MFVLTASIGTLVTVNVICACVALGVGFAAGVWFFATGKSSDDAGQSDEPQLDKEQVRATERALMASSRLKDLASNIACDVGSHASQVEELNLTLQDATAGSGGKVDASVVEALTKIVVANSQLQERLVLAEQQIEAQAAEIQSHETEARTDSLTGLANRRAFDDELSRRFSEWQRKHTPFTLLIMDIDHFKKFNDTHGHQAGDEVLRHVGAEDLTSATREMDVPLPLRRRGIWRRDAGDRRLEGRPSRSPSGFVLAIETIFHQRSKARCSR